MRPLTGVLALVAAGTVTLALADPPTAGTTPAANTPAAAATPAAAPTLSSAQPALTPDERDLLAQGYKPEMRHGQKVWCREEQTTGSRLSRGTTCSSADVIKAHTQNGREITERSQANQINKTGN
jgi:hypothetical protein